MVEEYDMVEDTARGDLDDNRPNLEEAGLRRKSSEEFYHQDTLVEV